MSYFFSNNATYTPSIKQHAGPTCQHIPAIPPFKIWGKGNQEFRATPGCILSSRKTWVSGDLRRGGEKGVGGNLQMPCYQFEAI